MLLAVLCSWALGIVPFALTDVVNGAIIAGIFSVVNTVLNIRLIRVARSTDKRLTSLKETATEAQQEMHDHLTNGGSDAVAP